MYVCNVNEQDVSRGNSHVEVVREVAAREDALVITVSAAVESEVAELPPDERAEFLRGLGMEESGLSKVIHEGYALLHLITFFTAGPKEVRAWTVRSGLRAPEAAGTIHSDFEKGFIRAEVMRFDDLNACGTEQAVRERGLLRIEGREYVIRDGDVVYVRFAV
jgi:ribosome-binding ATPase YchF (GTP1/OBG family)